MQYTKEHLARSHHEQENAESKTECETYSDSSNRDFLSSSFYSEQVLPVRRLKFVKRLEALRLAFQGNGVVRLFYHLAVMRLEFRRRKQSAWQRRVARA